MRQFISRHRPKLLQISRMQTWVSRNQDFHTCESPRLSISIHGNFDCALSLSQYIPRVTNPKEQSRFRNQDPASLLVSLVEHLVVLCIDELGYCGLDCLNRIHQQLLCELK